jgi:hypothetical protein|tara:strand:+ start:479 stop:697 length:219 start_codon:yes stop_codon:yes gene_type:complete
LLSFNWIGSVVPFRVLSMLSSAADAVVGTLFPKRVQHFIVTVRKLRTACSSTRNDVQHKKGIFHYIEIEVGH